MKTLLKRLLKGFVNQLFGDYKKNIPSVPERLMNIAI